MDDSRLHPRGSSWLALTCVAAVLLGPLLARADDPARDAVRRGLGFLEKDTVAWRNEHQCATCHHGTMTVWAYAEAKNQGYTIAPEVVADTVKWTKDRFLSGLDKPRDTRPGWKMLNSSALCLALMARCLPHQEVLTVDDLQRIRGHLIRHQESDGSWAWSSAPPKNRPPPFFESDDVATLMASAVLKPTGVARDKSTTEEKTSWERGADWLRKNQPTNTTQAVSYRLLVKVIAKEPASAYQRERDSLLSLQRKDGGWGQTPERSSDAYATGQALYVLSLAGVDHDRPEVKQAVAFLVSTQNANGSWPMTPRAHPGAMPSSYTVPITYFGSAWATLGLMRSVPGRTAP